jgi:glycosyltransferase involved in cell wall biosynthesis
MAIILAHIEPIEERYTKQWLDALKDKVDIIVGNEEVQEIKEGEFLDVLGTNQFKLEQGLELIKLIKEGKITENDTIFFLDLWNPIVTNIAYIRDCMDLKFKMAGLLHAGCWDKYDFLAKKELTRWAKGIEFAMIECVDTVIVATEFHKKLIQEYFEVTWDKIKVETFPVFIDNHKPKPKEDIVVFPHRLATEKQPHLFDKLIEEYKEKYPNDKIEWIKTKDVWTNKKEYYKLLSRAKVSVSFALQETFGIAMLESMNLGCIPFAPNRLSYRETLPDNLFDNMDELIKGIHNAIHNYKIPKPYKVKSFDNILKLL